MSHPFLDISGRICLVTGGTTGIGRAIALGFARAGAKVVAGSSTAAKVAAIAGELGPEHEAVQIDVCDEGSVAAAIQRAVHRFGKIDVLVNAAGIQRKQPAIDFPVVEFERIMRVNLTGTFVPSQQVARVMRQQAPDDHGVRGAILNIASVSSFMSLIDVTPYAASKSAIVGLTRGLANEWAQYGIRVNALAPGFFPTDLTRPLIEGTPRGEAIVRHTPWGRFGNVDELVAAAIYLVSPGASFTTGHTLVADGGFIVKGI
jgi:NAD(P)-dependent dehydrogenase (short-subunit alcohol dehydrogenase family)